MQTDIVIIGAGPVGLFAVFQAGMLGMKSCVFDTLDVIGGQCCALYPEKPIYDIPAYPQILAGNLIEQLKLQAMPFNPVYQLGEQVVSLSKEDNDFIIIGSKGTKVKAKAVIIAAGPGAFGPNKPPLEGIEDFENKSVFYFVNRCTNFQNKKIVIAGGGDSAVDWAVALSAIANKVYLVHRRDKFRALPESIKKMRQLAAESKIELVTGYQLNSLKGHNGMLEAVEVVDLDNNSKILPTDLLLPFFGLSQELGPIADWGLGVKSNHLTVEPPYFITNMPDVYAIGDIATYPGKLKLILTGFAEAASALHHAYGKVFDGKALHFEYSTTKGLGHIGSIK